MQTSIRKDTVSEATGGSEAGVGEPQSSSEPQASATGGKDETTAALPLVEEVAVMKVASDLEGTAPPSVLNTQVLLFYRTLVT